MRKTAAEYEATIDVLGKDLRSLAQIIHQAYHTADYGFPQGDTMTWRECPKDVCASVRFCIEEHAGQLP